MFQRQTISIALTSTNVTVLYLQTRPGCHIVTHWNGKGTRDTCWDPFKLIVGWVVGSLELLFNPTGMVRSFKAGLSDLVYLPYYGLQKGPGAFITGVSQGMTSVVRNVTQGIDQTFVDTLIKDNTAFFIYSFCRLPLSVSLLYSRSCSSMNRYLLMILVTAGILKKKHLHIQRFG